MVTTAPSSLIGYEKYKVERQTKESLLLSMVAEFWIAVVNIFGALYEVEFKSVYCKIDKAKITPQETQRLKRSMKFPLEQFRSLSPVYSKKDLKALRGEDNDEWRIDIG